MTEITKRLLAAAVAAAALTGTASAQTADPVVEHHPLAAWAAQVGAGLDYINAQAVQPATSYVGDSATWLTASAAEAVSSSAGAIGQGAHTVWQTVVAIPGMPARAMEEFVSGLHGEHFEEFATLVDETGFAIAHVEVGVGLIPAFGMEFIHERDLTPEELADVEIKIEAYTKGPDAKGSYVEAVILRSLVEAGRRAGGTDLNTVDVKLFPLPGLTLKFDPLDFEEHEAALLDEAVAQAEETAALEARIEARTIELEARERAVEARAAELEERMVLMERAVAALLAGRPEVVEEEGTTQ